jgi:CDP-glucose 4,6-dehydratase
MRRPDPGFWRERRVLLTGHTGFKGAWLMLMLSELGARVFGLSLPPEPGPALFPLLAPASRLEHAIGDLRGPATVTAAMRQAEPSVVLHLGAQALVPRGWSDPAGTFAVNTMGTIHVLAAMQAQPGLDAAVLVTTDKVYRNRGERRLFREDDPLGGDDPYSASKAAAELAVASWRATFGAALPPLATARAGNVIGGGDFASYRLVPDIVRTCDGSAPLVLRHPDAVRPWQHVLDVLCGYLLLAEHLAEHETERGRDGIAAVNFGPPDEASSTVLDLIAGFEVAFGTKLPWQQQAGAAPEAMHLALDPALAVAALGWRPYHDRQSMIQATADWYAAWRRGDDMVARCRDDIAACLA